MSTRQNKKAVSICITGDIDYFETETVEGCLSPLFRILKKYDVKMTLPITARAVKDFPERAQYVLEQGHEIAVHGDVHRPFYGTVEEQVERSKKGPRYAPEEARRIANIWLDIVRDMKRRTDKLFVVQTHPYIVSPSYINVIDIFLGSVVNDDEVELKLLGDVTKTFLSR